MYTYTCVDVSHLCRPPTPSTFINWINGCINFWAVSSGPHDWKNGDRIMMINHRTFGFQIVETPYRTYTQVSQWQKCPNSTVQSIPLSVKSPKFLLAKPYVLVKNELLLLTSEILVNFASLNLNCLLFIFSLPIRLQFQVQWGLPIHPSLLQVPGFHNTSPSTGLPNQRLDTVDQSFLPPSAWFNTESSWVKCLTFWKYWVNG